MGSPPHSRWERLLVTVNQRFDTPCIVLCTGVYVLLQTPVHYVISHKSRNTGIICSQKIKMATSGERGKTVPTTVVGPGGGPRGGGGRSHRECSERLYNTRVRSCERYVALARLDQTSHGGSVMETALSMSLHHSSHGE